MSAALPMSDPTARKSAGLLELAERAARGDTAATGALLKALAPQMIRTVHALLGPTHADADDVVQQAMIALVQALPQFRGECSPQHYASRIVARMVVSNKRRSNFRNDRRDDETDVDAVQSGATSQHDAFAAERRRELVRELMTHLPEEQAETFAMRVGLGFSLPEVAAATGVPLNTVRSRVRLAKEALRKRIDADPAMLEMLGGDA
ncbi:MAG: RNA polymerase sigma factor [Archangiaceae bacterium]|nr:RNA polymerase sigma factor [Archangiaceae bacterium]